VFLRPYAAFMRKPIAPSRNHMRFGTHESRHAENARDGEIQMMRVSEWPKDRKHKPREGALQIADDMGISDLEATSRHAAPRYAGHPAQPPSFVAMVVAEWHKLVADVSRAFARRRIHRTATHCRQRRPRVMLLRTRKERFPD
jgi:hypothetical protein